MQPRCSLDATQMLSRCYTQMQHRCFTEAAQMQHRCYRDQARCFSDATQMLPRCCLMLPKCSPDAAKLGEVGALVGASLFTEERESGKILVPVLI